ncbi:MAG: hypothetical protein PHG83_03245 [Patescibacteria group bacterium]|nr:hypothetical protein [Patescibacteria group bacterium]
MPRKHKRKKHSGCKHFEYPEWETKARRQPSKHGDSRFRIERDTRITVHHKIPLSRGGANKESNRKEVLSWVHKTWHRVFLNWTPDEIIRALKGNNRNFFIRNNNILEQDWFSLFGDKSNKEIIEIILREWS